MSSNIFTRYGECRFCLTKGDHQDMTKEYYHNSLREVYVDMFLECFNLFLSTHTSISTLICRSCVTQLRDASSFREMVVSSERTLIDFLNDAQDEDTVFINVPSTTENIDMKVEPKIERICFEQEDLENDETFDYDLDQGMVNTVVTNQQCAVPKCRNTISGLQHKVFFPVPSGAEAQRQWGKVLRKRNISGSFVCEDHFDIENDTQNYLDHKLDGATLKLKPGVVPHRSDRRKNKKSKSIDNEFDENYKQPVKKEIKFNEEKCDLENVGPGFIEGELALRGRFPTLQPLPTRSALHYICPEYIRQLRKLKGKTISARKIEKQINKIETRHKKRSLVSEKLALATNACALLENSNTTVFKTKMRSGYPCFYCRQIFLTLATLQQHQLTHPKSHLFKLLTKYTADELVVYADVTDLKCTICQAKVPSLNELKNHLSKLHKVKMYSDYTDRVVPFKLSDKDLECQVCGFLFETFGAVAKHMNTHYRNYVCEQCGAGFVTNHRLKIHTNLVHRQSTMQCDACKKTFNSQLKFKIHYDVVHKKVMLNKCPKCPDRFIDYFTRQKHLVEVHGEEPILYKCKVCDRSFSRRYMLSCHVKRSHLEQKDYQCELCPYMCYTKGELREHVLKHTGEKLFECSFCKKAFARKKSLDVHMRIHTNDRRFGCNVCGQAFVHKCSLKGHIRSQHPESIEAVNVINS